MNRWQSSLATGLLYTLTTLIGITAFLYPFFLPSLSQLEGFSNMAHAADAPLLLGGLTAVCVGVLLVEAQGISANARFVAVLAILVAFNSILRFLEVALPGPGGFTPIFFLITLGGYVFGAPFGFLLGALTLLVSAFLTGGVGPWLPYQMFTAGWVGLSAPLCRWVVKAIRGEGKWREVGVLTVFGAVWGFLYGAIMNLWFWPYTLGDPALYWQPGIGLQETLARYAVFYGATSAWWDVFGALGNAFLIATFGVPTLRVLRRFYHRFDYTAPISTTIASLPVSWRMLLPQRGRTGSATGMAIASDSPFPAALWVAWCGVITLWLSVTRNPLYLLLLAGIIGIVRLALPRRTSAPYAFPVKLLPLAAIMIPIAAIANALFTHFGNTVLFTLPKEWLLIGGPFTLEAALYGALTGVALWLLVSTFTVLNQAVATPELVALLPRALRPVGIVVIIALAFVPMLRLQAQRVREAQAVRGFITRGWRDNLPLLLPILIGGLEYAIQLAEAMTARGFGAQPQALPASLRWGMVLGLVLLFGGWWGWLLGVGILAQASMVLGAVLMVALLWMLGRLQQYTPYRKDRWRLPHGVALVVMLIALLPPILRETSLFYYPYPQLSLPTLDALSLGLLLFLLAPLVLLFPSKGKRQANTSTTVQTSQSLR